MESKVTSDQHEFIRQELEEFTTLSGDQVYDEEMDDEQSSSASSDGQTFGVGATGARGNTAVGGGASTQANQASGETDNDGIFRLAAQSLGHRWHAFSKFLGFRMRFRCVLVHDTLCAYHFR